MRLIKAITALTLLCGLSFLILAGAIDSDRPNIALNTYSDKVYIRDNFPLYFGDGGDASIMWDATDLDIMPAVDDSVVKWGDGTTSWDFWIYGNSATDYIKFDASANLFEFRDIDIRTTDTATFTFGAGITMSGDVTLQNGEIVTNATDAVLGITFDDDAAELGDFQIYSSNTSTANSDSFRQSWWFEDSGSVKSEFAYIDIVADDITSNSTDATFKIGVVTADTLAAELGLSGSKLYPITDEGLDLGGSSNEFKDLYIDGTANIDSLVADTADINAGTIDAVTIGASTAGTGAFTTITASSTLAVTSTSTLSGAVTVNNNIVTTGTITLKNGEIIDNDTDAIIGVTFNDDAVELGDVQIYSSNTSTADNDYLRISWYAEDDGSVKSELAQLDVTFDDVTSNTIDSSLKFAVATNDTLATELILTGAALKPNANAGLDLGSSALKFANAYIDGQDHLRTLAFSYYDVDTTASQTTQEWGFDPSADKGGANFKYVVMPYAGSIVGVSVYSNDACTSGTLTADPTINGTATGLQAGLNSVDDTQTSYTSQTKDSDTFTAGQRIGVKVTTSSVWAPTTADTIVTVFVEY